MLELIIVWFTVGFFVMIGEGHSLNPKTGLQWLETFGSMAHGPIRLFKSLFGANSGK